MGEEVRTLIDTRSAKLKHVQHYRCSVEMKRLHRVVPTEALQQLEQRACKLGKPSQLFHGTTPEAARNIIKDGFKLPVRNGMFGRGLYFAKDPLKSVNYALAPQPSRGISWSMWTFLFGGSDEEEEERYRNMLLCDVYLGNVLTLRRARPRFKPTDLRRCWCLRRLGLRDYNAVRAPGGCCGAVRVTEYVVYEQYQGIPRYLIEFDKGASRSDSKSSGQSSLGKGGVKNSKLRGKTSTGFQLSGQSVGGSTAQSGGATPPAVLGQAVQSDQGRI